MPSFWMPSIIEGKNHLLLESPEGPKYVNEDPYYRLKVLIPVELPGDGLPGDQDLKGGCARFPNWWRPDPARSAMNTTAFPTTERMWF